jgi:hypothetical protein
MTREPPIASIEIPRDIAGVVALAVATAALAALLIDPALASVDLAPLERLRLAMLNGLPVATLAVALAALTGRALASAAASLALYAALAAAGAIKLEQLGLPLLPADFRFLSAGGGAALFWNYVEMAHIAAPLAFAVLALLALAVEPRRARPVPAARAGLGLAAIVAAVTLASGARAWRDVYDGWGRGFEPWSPAETVARLGVTPTLLMYHWELSRPDRRPPDRDRVLEFIAEHADAFNRSAAIEGDGALPDIVVVQSESFFDPARLTDISERSTLPNFRRLAQRGWSGDMRVPTYGGGTIRTEFEFLSGVPLAAFPGVEYPYFELVDAPMPGLMRTLAEQGYRTSVLHPNEAAFWNRRDALARLGAERFLALPAFAQAAKDGLFVADAALTDRVIAELADDGPPQFLFAISMEAHGPYEFSPGLDADALAAIELPDYLDEHGARTLRHYLYHLANADRELGRLADVVLRRARPTVLLFYGDHLPGLHSSFAQIGFSDTLAPRAQPVPWLIVDNRRDAPRREDTASWMLPAVLLEAAQVPADAYLALVGALRRTPQALVPEGAAAPEPRFAELARLRVRDEFDADAFSAALAAMPVDALPADAAALDPAPDEAAATN